MTFTQVPGSRTVDEFFMGLRSGRGVVHGAHGAYAKLTVDVWGFATSLIKERPLAAAILPFTVFVPAITAGHWLNEIRFCKKWAAQLLGEARPRMLWDVDSSFGTNWAR
jgi:hypothetical protein